MEKVDKKRDMSTIKMIIKRKHGKNETGESRTLSNGYIDSTNNQKHKDHS